MKELTTGEEEIMQILWKKNKAFVKDIIAEMPLPKPAYNTVSTIVRILEKKGFVAYTAFGKTHEYYPLIKKKDYRAFVMRGMLTNYFDSSFSNVLSYFVNEKGLAEKDIEEIKSIIKKMEK